MGLDKIEIRQKTTLVFSSYFSNFIKTERMQVSVATKKIIMVGPENIKEENSNMIEQDYSGYIYIPEQSLFHIEILAYHFYCLIVHNNSIMVSA